MSSPSCTPSRGAALTGQWHWRLEAGANLWSIFPDKFATYPEILKAADIASVKYEKVGAWYSEIYWTFWNLSLDCCGESALLLRTKFRSRIIGAFTTVLGHEIESRRHASDGSVAMP